MESAGLGRVTLALVQAVPHDQAHASQAGAPPASTTVPVAHNAGKLVSRSEREGSAMK